MAHGSNNETVHPPVRASGRLHARAHVGDTQEGGRPYILPGSKPRKFPGAPPACVPLPPPPTSRRQHSQSVRHVLFAVGLTSIILTFWSLNSSIRGPAGLVPDLVLPVPPEVRSRPPETLAPGMVTLASDHLGLDAIVTLSSRSAFVKLPNGRDHIFLLRLGEPVVEG